MSRQKNDYEVTWQRYRLKERVFKIAFWQSAPAIALVCFYSYFSVGENLAFVIFSIHWIFLLFAAIWRGTTKCPRCGQSFHIVNYQNYIDRPKCVHCSLRKYKIPADEINDEKTYVLS